MDRSSAPRPTDRGWTLSSRTPPAPDGWQSRTPDRGSTDEDIKVPFHTLSFCASGSPAVRADRAVQPYPSRAAKTTAHRRGDRSSPDIYMFVQTPVPATPAEISLRTVPAPAPASRLYPPIPSQTMLSSARFAPV